MIIHTEFAQGSEAWEDMRRIRPTASRLNEICTAKKQELSASAVKYAAEIIVQSLYKHNPNPPKWTGNVNTDIGNEREAAAREEFSRETGATVDQVGFCVEDSNFFGCSPDGLIESADGEYLSGLELKCPLAETHAGYHLGGILPPEYAQQVHGSMIITGLREWFFMSYFPRMKPFLIKVEWDSYTDRMAGVMDDFRILYADTRSKLLSIV